MPHRCLGTLPCQCCLEVLPRQVPGRSMSLGTGMQVRPQLQTGWRLEQQISVESSGERCGEQIKSRWARRESPTCDFPTSHPCLLQTWNRGSAAPLDSVCSPLPLPQSPQLCASLHWLLSLKGPLGSTIWEGNTVGEPETEPQGSESEL